ncbi:MAG: HEAT repeat domain-containing protein [Planctomycetota bacterium]
MKTPSRLFGAFFALWLGLAPFAVAQKDKEEESDEPEVTLSDKEAKEKVDTIMKSIQGYKRDDFPVLELHFKKGKVQELGELVHPYTAKTLRDMFLKEKDPELRGLAAETLGKMRFDRKKNTAFFMQVLKKYKGDDDLFIAGCLRGIGHLGVIEAYEILPKYYGHASDRVFSAAVFAAGELGDKKAIRTLIEMYHMNAGTKGVSVRVDTGTAGPGDQMAAQRAGKSMQKKKRNDRQGAMAAIRKALKSLTGEDFQKAEEADAWFAENKERLDL